MATIRDSGSQLSEAQLVQLEKQLNTVLPEDYRRFLLQHNGGRPEPRTVDVNGLPGTPTDVACIYGIGDAVETCSIEWNVKLLSERLAQLGNGFLPIAGDSLGSAFFLSLRASDFGAVYFCDLQSVFANYDAAPALYFVASSFEEFLKQLRPFEK